MAGSEAGPFAMLADTLSAVLRTITRDVQLELGDAGHVVHLGRIVGVHIDGATLTMRIAFGEHRARLTMEGDWDGMRKLLAVAARVSPSHDAAAVLAVLASEKDVEIH